jgi:hypothetical protein
LRQYRSFEKARSFARSLGLKSGAEWREYAKSSKKPPDIPASPDKTYAEVGWAGMGDWLGTDRVSNRLRKFRSFLTARAFVRGLGLKSWDEWILYCKSGKKPDDIPSNPNRTYAGVGWAGWGDWLGYKAGARFRRGRSFKNARTFVRSLKIKNSRDWLAYCKSGKKPDDIPSNPNKVYADAGWVSWPDWLGYERRHKLRKKLALTKSASRRRPSSRASDRTYLIPATFS